MKTLKVKRKLKIEGVTIPRQGHTTGKTENNKRNHYRYDKDESIFIRHSRVFVHQSLKKWSLHTYLNNRNKGPSVTTLWYEIFVYLPTRTTVCGH